MKFSTVISALSIIALVGCASAPRQRNINEIPEYGNQPKSPEILQADQEFLALTKGKEKESFDHMMNVGWSFFKRGDIGTAIKRFNQAWLIDSTRYESYWGFAAAEGRLNNLKTSKYYYEKALSHGGDTKILNPEYAIVLREQAKAENNSEKLAEADNLFMSEIEAGNEKAACIYAYQLYRDNKKEEACKIMASCPDDKDNLKKACRM
jgi:Tfp pilus assembly protein PilF